MTRPQSIERIREALVAGPTPEWFAKDLAFNAGYALLRRDKSGHRTHRIDSYGAFSKPDGEFIAACNPSALKELLAYVEGLETELQAERKRFDWYFSLTDTTAFLPIYLAGVQSGLTPDRWREEIDKAVAAAIASQSKDKA